MSQPLTPAVFHILLALAGEERHGYDIIRETALATDGKLQMGPGTLYGTIKRLAPGWPDHRSRRAPRPGAR